MPHCWIQSLLLTTRLCTLHAHLSQAAGALQECDLDCTSAHDAASRGHLGCLQLLLVRHSSLALRLDANAETPLHLLDHRCKPQCCAMTAALLAAAADSPEAAAAAVCPVGRQGKTALQCTVRSSGVTVVDEYLDDEDCIDGDKQWYSVCHPSLRALVAAGALASLSTAAQRKDFAAQLLFEAALQYGPSDVSLQNAPPAVAAAADTTETLQQLQRAGLQLDLDRHMFEACIVKHNRCWGAVKGLLACGASASQADGDGYSPFYWAARQPNNAAVLQLLYDAAPRPRLFLLEATCTDSGQTALQGAAEVNCSTNVQKLLQLGARAADAAEASGRTPLHRACWHGEAGVDAVRALLAAGADAQRYSEKGPDTDDDYLQEDGCRAAVHFAACGLGTDYSNTATVAIIDLLLEAGATLTDTTTAGCTPLWLLVRHSASTAAAAAASA
jgi:ankyrin repeat protein